MSSDEYAPLPGAPADALAAAGVDETIGARAGRLGLSIPAYAVDRRGTAATLRAIDDAHGGGFFEVPDRALHEVEAADAAFGGDAPVIDVQTHLVDPALGRTGRGRARRLPEDGRSRALAGRGRPA